MARKKRSSYTSFHNEESVDKVVESPVVEEEATTEAVIEEVSEPVVEPAPVAKPAPRRSRFSQLLG